MSSTKDASMERTRKRVIGDYKKGVKPKELAEKYEVNINTVKSWISRYKKNAPSAPAPPRKVGAPFGNSNAVGNAGGGAPRGNTNALKHGGYSSIFWDTLDDDEKQMIEAMDCDGERLLLDEIQLLTVREKRIMATIKKHRDTKGGQAVSQIVRSEDKREFANNEERQLYEERIQEKVECGDRLPGRTYRLTTTTEATYDIVHRLEEALTRCQAQKQKCIDSLNKLRIERGDDGKAAPENNLLKALVDATKEDIDTNDIPELEQETECGNDLVE